ncbi:Uncharacterised protein [BD1-7 clade bacterium]|uniref:Uncharacterized protein n=1 Tax=BD1-7 clade bacterium TaxID=2029982 RepID=A0A5S9PAZ7_9GAMM|nr:Uncharacterised protein [BD1-7 clade bacterium]
MMIFIGQRETVKTATPNKAQYRLRNFVTFIAKSRIKTAKITPLWGRR